MSSLPASVNTSTANHVDQITNDPDDLSMINILRETLNENYIQGVKNEKGEEIAKVVLSGSEDFKAVIDSSKKSQYEWSQTTPLKRSRIL